MLQFPVQECHALVMLQMCVCVYNVITEYEMRILNTDHGRKTFLIEFFIFMVSVPFYVLNLGQSVGGGRNQ